MNSGSALFGSFSIATAGLGIWQLQRYYWKIDLIQKNEELFHLPLEPIGEMDNLSLSKKFRTLKGQKICVDGVYDHSKEILLGPRSAPGLETEKAQGMATNPMGFFVITPFYFNNGTRVFVNRGWKPQNCQEWSRPQGPQRTVGIVQDWEQKSTFVPDNNLSSGKLLWLEGNSLIQASKMKSQPSDPPIDEAEIPLLIERLDDSSDENASPKAHEKYPLSRSMKYLDHNYVTPEVHLAYSLTWLCRLPLTPPHSS